MAAVLLGGGVAAAAAPTTTPPLVPVPAPAPTQQPSGLGTVGALDQLAAGCFNGSMQACDDLYEAARQDPANEAYISYGDTCAGRQAAGTGILCAEAFLDGPGMGQPVGPTTTVAAPTPTGMRSLWACMSHRTATTVKRFPDRPEFDGGSANALVVGGAFRGVVPTSCLVAAWCADSRWLSGGGRGPSRWCRCGAPR